MNVIQNLVNLYNQSRHRFIGMASANVQNKDENRHWVLLFGNGNTHLKPQILQGDIVRANSHKTIFDKGYMPNWTKEHFTVSQEVSPRRGTKLRVYKLVDYNGEAMRGSWYPWKIKKSSNNYYCIDKVLRRLTLPDGTKGLFVQWENWPDKYNSWIKETDKYDVIAEWWVATKHCKGQSKKQT